MYRKRIKIALEFGIQLGYNFMYYESHYKVIQRVAEKL